MANKLLRNDPAAGRWFSTGFMSGGVASVDADKHTLHGAVLIRPGEALGHGMWIDKEMCAQVHTLAASGKAAAGLKCRFGHPNMCSEALGTFLGRIKNASIDESGFVRGDLFLSSTAAESPKGDLRKYVEELAAKEPNHFGASIVFTQDREAMYAFCLANGGVEKEDEYGKWIDLSGFKSPDPANVKNLPHARCAELHAADLVDDPAATDGMFSGAGGLSLAAGMTEWLDTHPDVFKALQEPGVMDLLTRYTAELRPFIERYNANAKRLGLDAHPATCPHCAEKFDYGAQPEIRMGVVACPKCGGACSQADCDENQSPAAEPAKTEEAAPAESGEMAAKVATLTAQAGEAEKQIAQLTGECASHQTRADALTAERDGLSAKVKTLGDEIAELRRKVAAYENGAPTADATPAPAETGKSGNLWDDARKTQKK